MKTEYLQFEDITLINEMSIEQHGGNFLPPHNFLISFTISPSQ